MSAGIGRPIASPRGINRCHGDHIRGRGGIGGFGAPFIPGSGNKYRSAPGAGRQQMVQRRIGWPGERHIDQANILACKPVERCADSFNIRSGPGVKFQKVGEIPAGSACVSRTKECRGRWCRVSYADYTGWVNVRYLRWLP